MRRAIPLLVAVFATALAAAAPAAAKPAAGPALARCGKLKRGIGRMAPAQKRKALRRFRACLKQNEANRIAFNQIKDSRFAGLRGDGAEVDDTYCANGKFESRISGSGFIGTAVATGTRWWVKGATVRQGGSWIDAFVGAPEGFEIALLRRGSQWQYGVASLGRILEPGDVEKSDAKAACRSL